DVAALCRRMDGLPLAIELAAAQTWVLSPRELLAHADRLLALGNASRTTPPRHRTMANAIGWSYDLLAPEEQAWFRRVAIFSGGWTLEEAEAVCASAIPMSHASVLACVTALVDASLVHRTGTVGGTSRFGMLET